MALPTLFLLSIFFGAPFIQCGAIKDCKIRAGSAIDAAWDTAKLAKRELFENVQKGKGKAQIVNGNINSSQFETGEGSSKFENVEKGKGKAERVNSSIKSSTFEKLKIGKEKVLRVNSSIKSSIFQIIEKITRSGVCASEDLGNGQIRYKVSGKLKCIKLCDEMITRYEDMLNQVILYLARLLNVNEKHFQIPDHEKYEQADCVWSIKRNKFECLCPKAPGLYVSRELYSSFKEKLIKCSRGVKTGTRGLIGLLLLIISSPIWLTTLAYRFFQLVLVSL